ncbi:hypothetical protein KXD93_22690 [Mucilaginibacter sp. BJC16-A38]|uniref:hypothetical protein n=1 Tax=Mucilaginibacter phenanthrenivorans TaxID=1234842 RepID=UPI002157020F|nr:hypothetical protein [Mucilaginibacter phenanthrenivorans]MCR8560480.1 hypothetical protein [Mucilaginibacter phenanthrenivorans]
MENSEKSIHEEIVDQLIIKVNELENQQIKQADYSPYFESLKQTLEGFLKQYNNDIQGLKNSTSNLNTINSNDQTKNILIETKGILKAIKLALPITLNYSFDLKTKRWIIAGMILLIITAISTGLSGYLWSANNRLEINDIKYRAIRQTAPEYTHWADTTYLRDPDAMINNTVKLEDEALEKTAMENIVFRKNKEAKAAIKRLQNLKKKK